MKRETYLQTITPSGKRLAPVCRTTEKGISDYANRMFRKYGDEVTVEEYYFDENMNLIQCGTWHA